MHLRRIPLGLSFCAAVTLSLFGGGRTASAITPLPPAVLNSHAATDSGDDYNSFVATDGVGNWVVVWYSEEDLNGTLGTDGDILVSRSSDNGATWSAAAPLHSHFKDDSGSDTNLNLAPTQGAGNWLVVWRSNDDLDDLGPSIGADTDVLASRSTDNGATWSAPEPVNNDADSDIGEDGWGTNMATDGAGTVVVTWTSGKNVGGTIGGDHDVIFARSTDNGVTWSDLAPLNTNADSDSGNDWVHAPVATDGTDNWVAVWTSEEDLESTGDSDLDHFVARSSDDGATWSAPEYLHDDFKTDGRSEEFRGWLATDGAGTWVVVWTSQENWGYPIDTDLEVLFSRSTDNGATWTRPYPISYAWADGDPKDDYSPHVATDRAGNWLVTWSGRDQSGGPLGPDTDILFSRSTDDGVTWTDPAPMNTNAYSDSGGEGVGLGIPHYTAADGVGNWVVVWNSAEDLGGSIGTDHDILYANFALRTVHSTDDDGDFSTADGTCDTDDSAGDGPCTLRAALEQANANPNLDNIEFDIAGAGPHTIQPASALPTITQPVLIDGYTQDGASANTNSPDSGSNAVLKIELDGTNAGAGTHGLTLTAGGSTIKGLAINRFGDDGIRVATNGGNTIEGCFIGTDTTGAIDLGSSGDGVDIRDAPDNTVGGTTPAARNVVSGNDYNGVSIYDGGATGNLVQGNLIGTDAAGTAALGNSHNAVSINQAPGNTIGGTTAAARNVASGSGNNGVGLSGSGATGNLVQGNYLGTDVTGTADLGNSSHGVIIEGAPGNTIGGTMPGAGNIASGNDSNGVRIQGSGATGNLVQGNYIGTDATGAAALGNSLAGVLIWEGSGNTVGGTKSAARNVVSGNGNNGVTINGSGATGNLMQGNYIGTDVSGTSDLGNDAQGVAVSSPSNTVGGAIAGAGNVISGNAGNGVSIEVVGTTGNLVQGNTIGTNAAGDSGIPNDRSGVRIGSGASGNTVGGTAPGESNIIAFNTESGVCVYEPTSTGNGIRGNSIHSNALLGIDLAPTWLDCSSGIVTANDAGDSDTGPNDQMNFPVIIYAFYNGVDTTVSGTLDTADPGSSTVDVYATQVADGSGYGEGQAYLGSATATGGSWELVFSGLPPYTYIYATATDGTGNTSEFSAGPEPDTDGDGIPDIYETDTGVYVSPTNTGTDPTNPDSDGDGVCDGEGVVGGTCDTAGPDNCPFVGPADQTNSDALPAGDVCQCGDLDDDGAIDADDVTIARQHLVGATIGVTYDLPRCNVAGPSDGGASDCDVADIFVLERIVAGRPATVENTCEASTGP
jgi:hypothetical protein